MLQTINTETITNTKINGAYNMIKTDWKPIIEKLSIKDNISIYDKIKNDSKNKELKIYPKQENIFRCFNYFNIQDTRVVILGQDPYHGENQATGLCFDTNNNKKPPSLKNIFKVLKKETNLENWAKQGVLMLNTSLTVLENRPGVHIKYWLPFTKQILEYINKNCENVIFVCWGAFAYNLIQNIEVNLEKHTIYVSSHPSPLSFKRPLQEFPPFITSDIFNKINEKLLKPIIW